MADRNSQDYLQGLEDDLRAHGFEGPEAELRRRARLQATDLDRRERVALAQFRAETRHARRIMAAVQRSHDADVAAEIADMGDAPIEQGTPAGFAFACAVGLHRARTPEHPDTFPELVDEQRTAKRPAYDEHARRAH